MQESVALYVHIPFCLAKCDYCDFFSLPCAGKGIPDGYVASLLSEAEWRARLYSEKNALKGWKTIYVGGGTPSLLSPSQLEFLLDGLKRLLPEKEPLEITVEMNPESLSLEHLKAMSRSGVGRLSLGIQSLNEKALKKVSRHCRAKDCLEALELVKSVWKGDLNLDVIAGLGGASQDEFEESLGKILEWEPEHISLYTLTVEEETPLAKRIEAGERWSQEEADSQWLKGRDMLKAKGYLQYEVSNFARPGHESVHNMTYWKQEDYIGIGSGASGSLYDFTEKGGCRWTNTRNLDLYSSFWTGGKISLEEMPEEREELPLEVEEFEYIMMGLRTSGGINSQEYKRRFSRLKWKGDLSERLGEKRGLWNDWHKRGMAERRGEDYFLTEKGLLFLNSFLTSL